MILILAGIALAVAAVLLLLSQRAEAAEIDASRRPDAAETAARPDGPVAPAPPPVSEAGSEATVPGSPVATAAVSLPAPSIPTPPISTTLSSHAQSSGETTMTEQTPPPPVPDAERRLYAVVTLMRDEVTGQIAVQVGGRVYRDVKELKDSSDWTRVEYAARDFALWMQGAPTPAPRTEERREPEAPATGGSMVEQINRILEGKLAGLPETARAVRLIEGPGGSVRIYIGVQSYSLDEVPDPTVRQLIREAVAEWEARQ